jgi:DNA (cytosine-5)-methyltransferase 1
VSYDIVVGNPPFKKITNDKRQLSIYKQDVFNTDTNNLFAFFIEKALKLAKVVSFIVPKSLMGTPEFNKTRVLLENIQIKKITDYGESAFKGVKIETISFIALPHKKSKNNLVEIESYITKSVQLQNQDYIFSNEFPYWLIYRNAAFDAISKNLEFNIFNAYRDRQITKKITKPCGQIRVLKSRNIASNKVVDIKNYDTYVDDAEALSIGKYLNWPNAVLVPNLTYAPRACFLPENSIVDGSVAILLRKNQDQLISAQDLEYFGSKEFEGFYRVARNFGTRSLNIDNNSVFFFGVKKYD